MSYSEDLLEQARHLATWEPGKPKQASLRRAISAAYYSLFHLLTQEGARTLVSDEDLRALVQRCFNHGEMKQACKMFIQRSLPEAIKPFGPVPTDLVEIARSFVDLQEKRHGAEYDLGTSYSRMETLGVVIRAEAAHAAWQSVRALPISKVFLASLVLGNKWNR